MSLQVILLLCAELFCLGAIFFIGDMEEQNRMDSQLALYLTSAIFVAMTILGVFLCVCLLHEPHYPTI
ncbi:hypothetical protein QR680_003657 [Steinernema hermaphroditum]|uniref:Uncharacterized protein n=1 Tax=Steinernema hermaphroditum TaxID=289476 RepID=A0AA39HNE0_9BILA|nr:hypothetical protein QR680_003657 [Steinernema hermaphroditum]